MKPKFIIVVLLLSLLKLPGISMEQSSHATGTLTVIISNFRSNRGSAAVALYNQEKAFPKSPEKAIRQSFFPINDKKTVAVFENLAAGEYAVSVFHDENNNKKMDTNFLGIPKEGVGASNNARGHFGPPKYKDAKFSFSGSAQTIYINITYL